MSPHEKCSRSAWTLIDTASTLNAMRPDMLVASAIRNGKGVMPGYFGVLREREILDVVAFLRTLN